jgi:hypothetical protein
MDIRLSISVSPPPRVLLSPSPKPAEAPPHPTSMPLPPEAIYSSKEELYRAIQAFASQHSYTFYVRRSTKINNSVRSKITYNCNRYGEGHPQNRPHTRQRYISTRKTGCQFSVLAVECSSSQWELRHRPGTEYSIHNHPPSQSISSHPAHRKLAQAEMNQARSLHNAGRFNILYIKSNRTNISTGIRPGQAITYLRETMTTPLQPYDIYDLNASFKREQIHGLSANDTLIQHLKDKGIHFKINITVENRTRHLFIAYPESIQLAQTNQDVILVDNTYKTNKFNMPLLHMIGK